MNLLVLSTAQTSEGAHKAFIQLMQAAEQFFSLQSIPLVLTFFKNGQPFA